MKTENDSFGRLDGGGRSPELNASSEPSHPSPLPLSPLRGEGEKLHPAEGTERGGEGGKPRGLPPGIKWRPYQAPVVADHKTGILVLHWARQIGKSFTLAGWAVERLLVRPGRLVTVLSNSRENGAEFVAKCAEICRKTHTKYEAQDRSASPAFQDLKMEVRIRARGKVGRIKVLAANPRTARGFSGDLILDEFAFHEDGEAIWAAAEPILASNKDFLCRIASTGNGKHNLFYRMVAGGNEFEVHGAEVKVEDDGDHLSPALSPTSGGEGGFERSGIEQEGTELTEKKVVGETPTTAPEAGAVPRM